MTQDHELTLDACPGCPPPFSPRLRSLARRLFRFPGLRGLHPVALQVKAVAQPAGIVTLRGLPQAESKPRQEGLTVISANLWHDWPRFRRMEERLETFARLVEQAGADLLLLQEAAHTPQMHSADWLARRLGMAYAYSRSNGHRDAIRFEEGLAILSRHRLGAPVLRQLSRSAIPFWRRMALGVPVYTPAGELMAFSVHLGIARRPNAGQLARLRRWIAEVAGERPALVGGDFNSHETSPQIGAARREWQDTFRKVNPEGEGTTHAWGGSLIRQRLDYIFLRPGRLEWVALDSRRLSAPGRPHSDHHAVLTRFSFNPQS